MNPLEAIRPRALKEFFLPTGPLKIPQIRELDLRFPHQEVVDQFKWEKLRKTVSSIDKDDTHDPRSQSSRALSLSRRLIEELGLGTFILVGPYPEHSGGYGLLPRPGFNFKAEAVIAIRPNVEKSTVTGVRVVVNRNSLGRGKI